MKSNETTMTWNDNARLPALVLLVDSEEHGLWFGASRDLVAELKQRMPGVAISSATTAVSRNLQNALNAAAFLGAPSAIVVSLFQGTPRTSIQPETDFGEPRIEILRSESPPDVEAIIDSYNAALLALAPDERFLPCN